MRFALSLPLATIVMAFAAMPAQAQDSTPSSGVFKTAGDLYPLCTSKDADDLQTCDWYLMGAYDMAVYFSDIGQTKASFCLSSGSEALQVRNAFVSHISKNLASRKFSAVSTLINALDAAYPAPCKK